MSARLRRRIVVPTTFVVLTVGGFFCLDQSGTWAIRFTKYAGDRVEASQEITLPGHDTFGVVFALSPDGKRALYGMICCDGLTLLDLTNGLIEAQLRSPPTQCIAFSGDGSHAVSAGRHGAFQHWDLTTLTNTDYRQPDEDFIRSVAYSPVESLAIIGGDSGKLVVWNLETKYAERELLEHSYGIRHNGLVWSSDGNSVLSKSWDASIRYWDISTGEEKARLDPGYGRVMGLALSPDGGYALSSYIDGPQQPIILWDLIDGSEEKRFGIPRISVPGWRLHAVSLAFSPDGKTALFGMDYGAVFWWDIEEWEPIHIVRVFKEELTFVRFVDDGRSALAVGCDRDSVDEDAKVRRWKLEETKS